MNSMKKMPGVGWRSTCTGVMAGRVPRRVPLNSISVVSGGLSELCYQQLTDSKKARKVRIPPSPPDLTITHLRTRAKDDFTLVYGELMICWHSRTLAVLVRILR